MRDLVCSMSMSLLRRESGGEEGEELVWRVLEKGTAPASLRCRCERAGIEYACFGGVQVDLAGITTKSCSH
jgi:hypothetical protein